MCYDTIPVLMLYCGQSNGRSAAKLITLSRPLNSSTPSDQFSHASSLHSSSFLDPLPPSHLPRYQGLCPWFSTIYLPHFFTFLRPTAFCSPFASVCLFSRLNALLNPLSFPLRLFRSGRSTSPLVHPSFYQLPLTRYVSFYKPLIALPFFFS